MSVCRVVFFRPVWLSSVLWTYLVVYCVMGLFGCLVCYWPVLLFIDFCPCRAAHRVIGLYVFTFMGPSCFK